MHKPREKVILRYTWIATTGHLFGATYLYTCLPLLTALTLTCCSLDREARHSFEVRREGGIPVAVTTGGPRYEGELFEYREELRLVVQYVQ